MRRRRRTLARSSTQSDLRKPKYKVQVLEHTPKLDASTHALGSVSPSATLRSPRKYPAHALSKINTSSPSSHSMHSTSSRPLSKTIVADIRQRAVTTKAAASKSAQRHKRSPTSDASTDSDDTFSGYPKHNLTTRRCFSRATVPNVSKKSFLEVPSLDLLRTPPKKTELIAIPRLASRRRSEIALASIQTSQSSRRHTDPTSHLRLTPLSIDDFALIGTVGHGAFGKVLLAHLKGSKRNYVAIKGIAKRRVARKIDTLMQEVANLKESLSHPFILTLYAVLQDADFVYFVTEYVPGGTLEHLLLHYQRWNKTKVHKTSGKKRFTPAVPLKLVCFYTAQITQALGFLHEHNILYNDLKLENVLVQMDGYCKLADLGLSYKIESEDDLLPLCGTPANMAPEVVRTGAATGTRVNGFDKAVDWWGLGVLMYNLYFGLHPFDWGDGMKASFVRILKGDVSFPSMFAKSNTDHGKSAYRDLVQRLLCVDRDKRLGSGKSGTKDVQSHAFFKELLPSNTDVEGMWVHLEKKLIRTPFLPREQQANSDDRSFTLLKRPRSNKDGAIKTSKEEKIDIAATLPEITSRQHQAFVSQLEYYVNESWFRA